MLRRNQVQVVADKLAGRNASRAGGEGLDEPLRAIYRRLEPVDDLRWAEMALKMATANLEDGPEIVEAVMKALEARRQSFSSLAELAPDLPPIRWLWPGWIPRGFLTLLGGAPGVGKSLVALDLARRILQGQAYPDGTALDEETAEKAKVLYVDAEAVPQVLNERAMAWGVDRSRLYVMLPPDRYGLLDLGWEEHQERLIEPVEKLRPALVVVDSLSSINRRGENNVEEVREVLGFLSALAREYEVGLLLIHHLRKRDRLAAPLQLVSAEDLRGSSHIVARACSVLVLSVMQAGREPDLDSPRRLEVVKTNLARYPKPLGIQFEAGEGGAPRLRVVEAPRWDGPTTQVEECAAWLVGLLEERGEALRPRDVVQLAEDEGFSRTAVYDARRSLEGTVVDTEKRQHPENRWRLVAKEET